MHDQYNSFFNEDISYLFANSDPVILVGRGGSGTRLLSQLALSIGVFLGNKLNISLDSEEWVEDIYKLAIGVTSTTEIDTQFKSIDYWVQQLQKRAATILKDGCRSPKDLWGWKLPETILALPQVLKAFPNAYVIHLVRHPLTNSWRRTHRTSRTNNPVGLAVLEAAYQTYGIEPDNIHKDDPYFRNVITWTYQVKQAYKVLNNREHTNRNLIVRYEDICDSATREQEKITKFLRIKHTQTSSLPEIDSARINPMPTKDSKTEKAWLICRDIATKLGYKY